METKNSTLVSGNKQLEFGNRQIPGTLLSRLEDLQDNHPHKFLPEETLREVASELRVPLTQVYSVASFYAYFNLKPQGEHTLIVCRGTACHTKGSKNLFLEAARQLHIDVESTDQEMNFTTGDLKFTIRTVACFGQCAQAPVISIDDRIYGMVDFQQMILLIQELQKSNRSKNNSHEQSK